MDSNVIKINQAIREIFVLFSKKDYAKLNLFCERYGISGEDLRLQVEEFNLEVVTPNEINLDIVEISDNSSQLWNVRVPLYDKGGETDLTLEIEVEKINDEFILRIEDLHVL